MSPRLELSELAIGQVLRDARPKAASPPELGDYTNLYAATAYPGGKLIPLEAGINAVARVAANDGPRTPAILVASSPHKIGMRETPWQDHFEPDNGYIRYNGDNRTPGADPVTKTGNRALIAAFETHSHHDVLERQRAVPLIFFRRVPREGKAKGYVQFQGFGIVAGVELVTQFSERAGGSFTNYVFDFLVMSLAAEAEVFDWRWVNARRDPSADTAACLEIAPAAWRDWVAHGHAAIDRVRRRVSKLSIEAKADQLPEPGSATRQILDEIYRYYDGRKARFEALAAVVAERTIAPSGANYLSGGLTRASADGGIDFIGRLDIGGGFDGGQLGPAKLLILGQAKCEQPGRPTHGRHVARTVARLRRGWLGAYVTTSFFSTQTQREVIEDRYPIVLINGKRLAEEVHKMAVEAGGIPISDLLDEIDEAYGQRIELRDPEELLLR